MISEETRDTEDWSNGVWIFSFAIIWINYNLEHITIENARFLTENFQ